MTNILKPILGLAAAAFLFASCEEFQPVFTGKYKNPDPYTPVEMEANTTIEQLKKMYVHSEGPKVISEHIVIKGQVTSSDQSGNLYRSFYIQDETGGIEIKIGKTGLYNDYKLGQWIYIDCEGLTLGGYRGMINLGWKSTDEKYESSYIDVQALIDQHIFRGPFDEPVKPTVITPDQMMNASKDIYNKYYGMLVTVQGLVYADASFTLAYVNPDGDRNDYTNNALFLDEEGGTWGVTTWAMSDTKFMEYLGPQYPDAGYEQPGNFDACSMNNGVSVRTIRNGEYRDEDGNRILIKPQYCSVSQYFKFGERTVQVRTSGYARFADTEIDQRILNGTPINLTGIFSIYTGSDWAMEDKYDPEAPQKQFTIIDIDDIEIVE